MLRDVRKDGIEFTRASGVWYCHFAGMAHVALARGKTRAEARREHGRLWNREDPRLHGHTRWVRALSLAASRRPTGRA